ncbi:MAG TPA: phage holin family protein [Candidatus Limnocylindria bacterium]|jgi:hypothetical protein
MTQSDQPRPGMFDLARQLVSGVIRLARLEVTQGRQEIGEMLAETRTGAVMFGVAAAILLLALISLDLVLVLGVVALFDVLPPTVSAIIIVAAFVAILALYGAFGVFGRMPGALVVVVLIVLIALAAAFALPIYLGFVAGWHSAMFVLMLELAIAGLFIVRGIAHVRIGKPEQTIESVKEDIAWAKRLLRRG